MTTLVFHSPVHDSEQCRAALARRMQQVNFALLEQAEVIDDECYAILLYHPHGTLKKCRNLKGIISIAAGVDHLLADADVAGIPIYRQTDVSLQQTMNEYALMAVLMLQRDMHFYTSQQRQAVWRMQLPLRLSSQTRVGILGIGHLGQSIAETLRHNNFMVMGWSRRAKTTLPYATYSGMEGLSAMLPQCDILLTVLPHTPATHKLIDTHLLQQLPKGAGVINIGRGGLLNQDDLMAQIDAGHIAGAVLDVYAEEPLPPDSRLWSHPRIIMTPHIAGDILMDTALDHMLDKLALLLEGKQPSGLYDQQSGY